MSYQFATLASALLKFYLCKYFHLLEVVGRGGETQRQVNENTYINTIWIISTKYNKWGKF